MYFSWLRDETYNADEDLDRVVDEDASQGRRGPPRLA